MHFPDPPELKAAGFQLQPLPLGGSGGLRLAVLMRVSTTSGAGPDFVVIREFLSGRSYLGALIDLGNAVHEWLEIWVQDVGSLANCPSQSIERSSSLDWDRRWIDFYAAAKRTQCIRPLEIGFESTHPIPLFYNALSGQLEVPVDPGTGSPWELETDDRILAQSNLPKYSESLQRFLRVQNHPERPLTTAGPTENVPDGTVPWSEAVRNASQLVPFNAEGGLMQVHRFARLSLDAWVQIINGERDEREIRDEMADVPGLGVRPGELPGRAALMMSDRSAALSRYLEVLHAKLSVFREMLSTVCLITRRTKQPFLNLGASSFRVATPLQLGSLPWAWACTAVLVRPSGAGFVAIGGGRHQIPVPIGIEGKDATYLPENVAFERPAGKADVKLVKQSVDGDLVRLTAILRTAMDLCDVILGDHCLFSLKLGGRRVWFSGRVIRCTPNPVKGQIEVESSAERLDPVQLSALERQGATLFLSENFQVFPNLGSPCDMHALAILLARILFGNQAVDFRDAVRDIYRLASEISAVAPEATGTQVGDVVARIMRRDVEVSDVAWMERLSSRAILPPAQGRPFVEAPLPDRLWADCLTFLLRLLPRQGSFSWCADLAGPPAEELSGIFETPLSELDCLLERIRGLLFGDPRHEAEVGAMVREFLKDSGY